MSSTNKNRNLSATLPGNGARKVLDNPQKQGINASQYESRVSIRRSKKEKLSIPYN